jgi:DegV family protein with EDD domain
MATVSIVTDGMARLTKPGLLNGHPIIVAPTVIRVGARVIEDDAEVDLEQVFGLGGEVHPPPIMMPPSVDALARIYARLLSQSEHILSIHASSRLTDTAANARLASQQFLGRCDIQVVDSLSMSVGLGLLVQAAAEAASSGAPFDEIVRIVRGMITRLYMVFFLEELDYLERLGRISRSQAVLGNMLGIIPFLTLEEGDVIPMEKVRSRPRAIEKLVEFV